MPYTIRKVPNKRCYRVINKSSRRVTAKCTTKKRAQKQMRLLHAIMYNKEFKARPRKSVRASSKHRKTVSL